MTSSCDVGACRNIIVKSRLNKTHARLSNGSGDQNLSPSLQFKVGPTMFVRAVMCYSEIMLLVQL